MTVSRVLRRAAAGGIAAAFGLFPAFPAFAGAEPFLGEVEFLPYTFCPSGFIEANGQILQISQNTALFSLLGTNFGGNGTSTFALPAIRPPIPANGPALRACIATQGIFPSRS